jgi:hypothetical protein
VSDKKGLGLAEPNVTVKNDTGAVEVFYGGYWGFVCDEGWDIVNAQVVCIQMGQAAAKNALEGRKIEISGSKGIITWMKGVACKGTESKLEDCPFIDGWKYSVCSTTQLAGVECCV